MWTIIIFVLIFVIIGAAADEANDGSIGFLGGAFIGLILGLIIAFALPADLKSVTQNVTIHGLGNDTVKGDFFLAVGADKEGKAHYTYFYHDAKFFETKELPYNQVTIRNTTKQPRIIITTITETDSWINHWAFDGDNGNVSYTFEIPEGIVKTGFSCK